MKEKTNIRIVDIAKAAGVSAGTVDRVLHKRGHVSEEKRKKVEKVLSEIHYEPNLVASFLASKRSYRIAVVIPTYSDGEYWELVSQGIQSAEEELKKFKISIEFFQFNQYDQSSFLETTRVLMEKTFDGVIVATLFGDDVVGLSKKLEAKEIPYIFIDSNIATCNSLAYFGGDSEATGRTAAQLLLKEIDLDANILITFVRYEHKAISVQIKARETGFLRCLQDNGYRGKIKHLELNPDNSREAEQELRRILQETDKPMGGIVLNSRIYELVALLKKLGPDYQNKLHLMGHDPIDRNIEALKAGDISFLLSLRPEQQGYNALKALGNYFLFKQAPHQDNYMPIDILIKENVDYYNNYKL